MLKYIFVPGLVYSNETDEQATERERQMIQYNKAADEELEKWKPGPATFYKTWCEKQGL